MKNGSKSMKWNKNGLIWGICCAGFYVLHFNPLSRSRTGVTSFDRTFGGGLITDYDISRVTRNFLLWFLLFATVAFLCISFFCYLRQKKGNCCDDNQKAAWGFLDSFQWIALTGLVLSGITYFEEEAQTGGRTFSYSSVLIFIIALLHFIYILTPLHRKIDLRPYEQALLIASVFVFPVAVLISPSLGNGEILAVLQFLACSGVVVFLIRCQKQTISHSSFGMAVNIASITFAILPLFTSFYIELLNVLTQYHVFAAAPGKCYAAACVFPALVTICLYASYKNRSCVPILCHWEKWAFPLLALGIGFLSVQYPLQFEGDANLFESANSSVLISDFLNFGKLPIVEHYGGHMLTGVTEGILYGIINQDRVGAIFAPYSDYIIPVILLILYFLLKQFLDERIAFFSVILLPLEGALDSGDLGRDCFGLGIVVCLAFGAYVRRPEWRRAFLVWFVCAVCALYRLDLGFAFIMGLAAVLLIRILLRKDRREVKHFAVTLMIFGLLAAGAWSLLCISRNIDPLSRLYEFIKISASNQNWSYSRMGDDTRLSYAWYYLFLPFTVILCLLVSLFTDVIRKRMSDAQYYIMLLLGFAYFGNYARGIVRHNLVESSNITVWSSYLFLAVFCAAFVGFRKLVPLFMAMTLAGGSLLNSENFSARAPMDDSVSEMSDAVDSWQTITGDTDIERVQWSDELKQSVEPYDKMLHGLLSEDETYLDFINQSFIYSAVGKEDPVYVAQSPAHLSGDDTQEQFIHEMEANRDRLPIVLMPHTTTAFCYEMDGIPNSYRYYRVAEYIYQHYVPLCKKRDFAVWVLPERYQEFYDKIHLSGDDLTSFICQNPDHVDWPNCRYQTDENGFAVVSSAADPGMEGLQHAADLAPYAGIGYARVTVNYTTDTAGLMQLFYANEGDSYTEENSVSQSIEGTGTTSFEFPVTDQTQLRLDIPEGSTVVIHSIRLDPYCYPITYGYDGPYVDNGALSYEDVMHIYNLDQLPYLWARFDEQDSVNNEVQSAMTGSGSTFVTEHPEWIDKSLGNYICVTAAYEGEDDGTACAVLRLGSLEEDGTFDEKYKVCFTLRQGLQSYMIRVSADYYWYSDEINAAVLDQPDGVSDVTMKVLCGD